MLQQLIVLMILLACAAWITRRVYRFFKPLPSGKACGGSCCDGGAKEPAPQAAGPRVMMISSDDLRNRLKTRRN